MDHNITITLTEEVYVALNEARKRNQEPVQDPTNPERTIVGPKYASVEEWLEDLVTQNIAPIVAQQPTTEQKALQAQMEELQKQYKASLRVAKVHKITK